MFPDDPWKRRQAMMAAQAIREGRMSPVTDPTSPYSQGTSNPYALPPDMRAAVGKDFSGPEARVERLNQMAQQLRGTPLPQGKTVGPSNIYVGPNWGEMLAYGANQVMGGLAAKKARQQSEAMDEEKNRKEAALALQKTMDQQRERDQQLSDARQGREWSLEDREAEQAFQRESMDREQQYALEKLAAEYGWKGSLEELKAALEGQDGADDLENAIKDLSAPEQRYVRMLDTSFNEMNQLIPVMEAAKNAGKETGGKRQFFVDAFAAMVPSTMEQSARNWAKDKTYDEMEKEIRGRVSNVVESFRRARTGANLTGIEVEIGEDWDPSAKGISLDESIRRMKQLQEFMGSSFGSYGLEVRTPKYEKPVPMQDSEEAPSPRAGGGRSAKAQREKDDLDEQIRKLEKELFGND